jgi:hypothetical protein
MIITVGFPYLHYRLYKNQQEDEAYLGEEYSHMIEALDTLWDTYVYLSLPLFPCVPPQVHFILVRH